MDAALAVANGDHLGAGLRPGLLQRFPDSGTRMLRAVSERFDDSGLNLGPLLDADIIRERILAQLSGQPLRQLPYTGMGAYL